MKSSKKFIMIVNAYPHPHGVKRDEEDFFLTPAVVMKGKGYACEYVTLRDQGARTIETIGAKDQAYEEQHRGFTIRRFDRTRDLLSYVKKERAIVQANLRPWLPTTLSALLPNTKVLRPFTYYMGSTLPISIASALLYRRFDRILTVTPYEGEVYRRWKVPQKKICHIPLEIDYGFYSKKVNADDLRKKYGITKNDTVVVAVANFRKLKRFDVLVKALTLVKKEIPTMKAIVVGTDMLHLQGLPSLAETARKLGVADSVILTGNLLPDAVRKIYSISDVFCHPAADEYQGLVSYEAAAMGLPLCLSAIGSHTSVYKNHALYHEVGDFRKLARDIIASVKKRDAREEHVSYLRGHMKNWDHRVIRRKTSEFYDELLRNT